MADEMENNDIGFGDPLAEPPVTVALPGIFQHPALKTTAELLARYGNPSLNVTAFEAKWMQMLTLPNDIHILIKVIPQRIYVNADIITPLVKTFRDLIAKGLHTEIKTWDGCFNIRSQRGSTVISRHSWGIALDMNAAYNPLNGKISWTNNFLNVWRSNNWICGADFHSRKDGMHFERTAANSW